MHTRKTFTHRPKARTEMFYRFEKIEREIKVRLRRFEKLAARGRLKTEH
ncbi:MAG: hypothetical protein JSS81_07205 [Acidobacteria bacterium]|nr:hypothetical protein [Acidobacteriota bacterium]